MRAANRLIRRQQKSNPYVDSKGNFDRNKFNAAFDDHQKLPAMDPKFSDPTNFPDGKKFN